MSAQLSPSPGAAGPVEVRPLTPGSRTAGVAVLAACAAFFAWLAYTQPSRGHEFGYGLACVLAWYALYLLRVPEVAVRADESGFTYVDGRWAMLMRFPEERAAWSDVLAVDTRQVSGRYGNYLRTRVTVRVPEGDGKRSFTITSRASGYMAFLGMLKSAAAHAPVEMKGVGADPAQAAATLVRMRTEQARTIAAVIALGLLLIVAMRLLKR